MMIPLSQAIGRAIRCPDPGCGAPARVEAQRGRPAVIGGAGGPAVVGRVQWPIVHCSRSGGRSWPGDTMVEVLSE
jgi:hypothetical protein